MVGLTVVLVPLFLSFGTFLQFWLRLYYISTRVSSYYLLFLFTEWGWRYITAREVTSRRGRVSFFSFDDSVRDRNLHNLQNEAAPLKKEKIYTKLCLFLMKRYVICNKLGTVLRRFPSMSQELAEKYADNVKHLAWKARGVVRDMNPLVATNTWTYQIFTIHTRIIFCPWHYVDCASSLSHISIQNDLQYLRIRAKRHEIMVAFGMSSIYHVITIFFYSNTYILFHMTGDFRLFFSFRFNACFCFADKEFLVIIIQRWTPAGSS